MLQILRTNQPLIILVIAIYAVLISLHAFLLPFNWVPQSAGLLSQWLYERIAINSFEARSLAVLLLLLQAILINYCANNYKITKVYTYFPAAFYLLLVGFLGESGSLSPVLLGNTFVIIALLELYKVYKKDSVFGSIFNIGFWLSVGSLFYTPVAIFLVFGLMGLSVLRAFRVKEWMVMLIGFLVPLFLLWAWFYFQGRLYDFARLQFIENWGFLDFAIQRGLAFYVRIGFLLICFLAILVQYREYLYKRNIQAQKYISLLVWATFILTFTPLFQKNVQLEHFIMIAPTLSIFLSLSFLNIKTKPIAEFTFVLFFAGVLLWQYHDFLFALIRG